MVVLWCVLLLFSVGGVALFVRADGIGALRSIQGLERLAWMVGMALGMRCFATFRGSGGVCVVAPVQVTSPF